MACGEGYGTDVLGRTAAAVVGVDANPEAHEHARLKYTRPGVRFARDLVETYDEPCDAVVFLQTIEHVQDPDAILERFKALVADSRQGVGLRLDPQPAHAGPARRREVREPVARQGVPGAGVPRTVRGALPARRDPRPAPRAQARRPRIRDRPAAVGRRSQGPARHQALLRLVHAGHQRARLRAERGPRSRRGAGLPRRVPDRLTRCRAASRSCCTPTCPTWRALARGRSARSGCGRRWRPRTSRCSTSSRALRAGGTSRCP